MLDSFIVGALTSLILSGFYFLFKKPNKKIHLYIQNAILTILFIFLLIGFIGGIASLSEFPTFILLIIVDGLLISFIVKKFLNNLKQLRNNDFEE